MRKKRVFKVFRSMLSDAEKYQSDRERADALAGRAWIRAENRSGPLGRVFDDLKSFIRLLHAWGTGRYKQIPWKSVSLIIAAVLYFVSPIDAIPDFIPGIGLLDDAFVIAWVMRQVRKDVEDFNFWEDSTAWR